MYHPLRAVYLENQKAASTTIRGCLRELTDKLGGTSEVVGYQLPYVRAHVLR